MIEALCWLGLGVAVTILAGVWRDWRDGQRREREILAMHERRLDEIEAQRAPRTWRSSEAYALPDDEVDAEAWRVLLERTQRIWDGLDYDELEGFVLEIEAFKRERDREDAETTAHDGAEVIPFPARRL